MKTEIDGIAFVGPIVLDRYRARREALRENLRLAPDNGLKGRPSKKARRHIHRFNESL